MKLRLSRLIGVGFLVALLSACAGGGYLLDNDVETFSSLTAVPPQPAYRFERLPSQQAPWQAQLETMADPALHAAGFRRDDANPRYTVQVSGGILRILSPWTDGQYGIWSGRRGVGFGFNKGLSGWEPYWYHRDVTVIVRELPSNRVVFESHAVNNGPWVEDQRVFAAMFQAALYGFPNPPPGPRRVDIPVGGR
jgi:hypothetical protein